MLCGHTVSSRASAQKAAIGLQVQVCIALYLCVQMLFETLHG